jgi:hypothetical protein
MAQGQNSPVVIQTGGSSGMGAMVVALVVAAVLIVALLWWRPWNVATPTLPQVPTDINIRGDINVNPPSSTAP